MTALRDQMRDASMSAARTVSPSPHTPATYRLADASYDNVVAPLLRDLLARLDDFQDGHPCCDADHDGLITRTKELLS